MYLSEVKIFVVVSLTKVTGIRGNRVLLKNITAEILIGENYKTELIKYNPAKNHI